MINFYVVAIVALFIFFACCAGKVLKISDEKCAYLERSKLLAEKRLNLSIKELTELKQSNELKKYDVNQLAWIDMSRELPQLPDVYLVIVRYFPKWLEDFKTISHALTTAKWSVDKGEFHIYHFDSSEWRVVSWVKLPRVEFNVMQPNGELLKKE